MAVAERPPALRYAPQPKQEAWHRCGAFESGFGGTKGPGKTLAMLMESVRGVSHPRYRGIIFRRTYPRLQEIVDRAWEWFPPLGGHWQGTDRRWVFPSGASIAMRHCQHEEDKRNYHGHEYHFMGFDQLEEFSETQYLFLMAQCRSSVPDIVPYLRSTFNPGGIGHAWVKERFIDHGTRACAPWFPTNDAGDQLPARCFHFSNIYDNKILLEADPQYLRVLDSLPKEDRRALKDGDWDVFAGQMFTEWRRDKHVIEPCELGPSWPTWGALDYGTARPFVELELTQDPATLRVFVASEISKCDVVPASRQAKMILERRAASKRRVRFTVADPAMWIRQGDTGKSLAQIYAEAGVPLVKASNDRLSGLARVREFLADDDEGRPYLQVFSTCTELIKNMPSLVRDPHHVEDVDTDGPDDEYDCLVAGTAVITDRGEVPIETVCPADLVLTRGGYRPVVGSWLSHPSAPVLRVELSDGRSITGTPNHRIPRDDGTYTTIGQLRYGDIMAVPVAQRSASTDLRTHRVAPAVVVSISDAGRAPVFNLQVEDIHEYFANGVLVSNSLRYGLMAAHWFANAGQRARKMTMRPGALGHQVRRGR